MNILWQNFIRACSSWNELNRDLLAFFVQDNKPYLFASDFIGAPLIPDMETNGFVVAGTCTEQLFGMCESMWHPGNQPIFALTNTAC